MTFKRPDAYISLATQSGVLPLQYPTTVGLETRQLRRVDLNVYPLTYNHLRALYTSNPTGNLWKMLHDETPHWIAAGHRQTVTIDATGETGWHSQSLDLRALTKMRAGAAVVHAEPTDTINDEEFALPAPEQRFYQWTDLGIHLALSRRNSKLHISKLSSGKAAPGVTAELWLPNQAPVKLGAANAEGEVDFAAFTQWGKDFQNAYLFLEDPSGADHVLVNLQSLDSHYYSWRDTSLEELLSYKPGLHGETLTERGVYKPGEEVYTVAWMGVEDTRTISGLAMPPTGLPLDVTLLTPEGETYSTTRLNPLTSGKVHTSMRLPKHAQLGRWIVEWSSPQLPGTLSTSFRVEDYRAPAFEVQATASQVEISDQEEIKIKIKSQYYFGGPAPISNLRSQNDCNDTSFSPAGLQAGWAAGIAPQWSYRLGRKATHHAKIAGQTPTPGEKTITLTGNTDEERHTKHCQWTAAVRDPSLQEVGAAASYTVHPARRYIGLRVPQETLIEGSKATLELRGVDWRGSFEDLPGKGKVFVSRIWSEPVYARKGKRRYVTRWNQKQQKVKTCPLPSLQKDQNTTCKLQRLKEGRYLVHAEATLEGRKTVTKASFYVIPKQWAGFWGEPSEELDLTVPRKAVRVGDTIPLLLQAKDDLQGTILIERGGVREALPFTMKDGRARVDVVVQEAWVPSVSFKATAWVPGQKQDLPEVQSDEEELEVLADHRNLQVQVEVQDTASPGQSVPVKIKARDDQGPLTQGFVTIWAVDEAVLSLTDYEVPNLVSAFSFYQDAQTHHLHSQHSLQKHYIELEDELLIGRGAGGIGISGSGSGSGGVGGRGRVNAGLAKPRSKFKTTPLFLGDAKINARGEAITQIELPENLTTFRVIAVASTTLENTKEPGRFGSAKARLRVQKPLIVQGALPRHLRPGDEASFAVIVTNRTGDAGTLKVEVQNSTNESPITLIGNTTATKSIQPDQTMRVPFTLRSQSPGEATLTLRATLETSKGRQVQDAVLINIPIATESTLIERVAVYGQSKDNNPIQIPVRIPENVNPNFGHVQLEVSASLLDGLADVAKSLVEYPYGCAEQTASRLLPLVAMRDLSGALGMDPKVRQDMMDSAIARLISMQTTDGGFAYWPGAQFANVYASTYVIWILHQAQEAGLRVPPKAMERAMTWLQKQTHSPDRDWPDSTLYTYDIRRSMAVYVLAKHGKFVPTAIDQLWDQRLAMPWFARAFLLMAMQEQDNTDTRVLQGKQELLGAVQELQGRAGVTEAPRYDLSAAFHSETRSDAITLLSLLQLAPEHPVVTKMVRSLMERRKAGAWRNTQENAWALLSLARYARKAEAQTPDFQIEANLGTLSLMEQAWKGRGAKTSTASLPMAQVHAAAFPNTGQARPEQTFALRRIGQGRAYYRLEMAYAPQGPIPARARGLTMNRTLRRATGDWQSGQDLAPGEVMALEVEIKNRGILNYMAIDIPLPAGLEAIQTTLKTAKAFPVKGPRGRWVSHEELHKDRALLFADTLPPGTHRHTVYVRATTPGRYQFPPSQAKAMYAPEVFGRTQGDTLTIANTSP